MKWKKSWVKTFSRLSITYESCHHQYELHDETERDVRRLPLAPVPLFGARDGNDDTGAVFADVAVDIS